MACSLPVFYGAIVLGRRLVGTSDKDIYERALLLTGCVVLYIAFVFDFYSYVDPSIVSFSYIETFTVAVLFAANVLLGKSYLPVSRNAGGYGLLLGLSLSLFGGMSLWVGYDDLFIPRFLLWVSLL